MPVTKAQIDLYRIRTKMESGWNTWGNISLEFGRESVNVMINSDFGHYAYNWTHTGPDPYDFLCRINRDYAMNKLSDGKLYEPDVEKFGDQVKKSILELRYDRSITKEQARDAWDDLIPITTEYNDANAIWTKLIDSDWFNTIFGDYENLPSAQRVRPEIEQFWKYIWLPFVDHLKEQRAKGAA